MASTIGSYAPTTTAYRPIKTTSPKPADVFKELTRAKNADDYYNPSPSTHALQNSADNPVYAAAQQTIASMNGLAKQASDPSLSAEERDSLNAQYQDMANQLKSLGIGNGTSTSTTPGSKLSGLDLGVGATNLSSPTGADAATAATDAAFEKVIQQQSIVQGDAYGAEGADRNAATQQFQVESFLENQQQQATQDNQDVRVNAAVSAYKTQQETTVKKQGVLKLLA